MLLLVADLALALAALTAWAVVWSRREHEPIARFLMVVWGADLIRRALAAWVLTMPGPYIGGARVAFHAEEALYLLWPFGLVALAIAVFARRKPWIVGPFYASFLAILIASYPSTRGAELGRLYLGAELAAVLVSAAVVVPWGWRRERPTLSHAVVLALLAVDVAAILFGPFRGDLFSLWPARAWPEHAVLYTAITLAQGGVLWKAR